MTMYLSRFRKDQTSASHSDSWSGFAVREIPHGMLSMLYSIYIYYIYYYIHIWETSPVCAGLERSGALRSSRPTCYITRSC